MPLAPGPCRSVPTLTINYTEMKNYNHLHYIKINPTSIDDFHNIAELYTPPQFLVDS